MKKNVLLLETIANEADVRLRSQTNVLEAFNTHAAAELAVRQPVHGIVTRGKGQVTKELMQACPDLEVITRCGVGLDNVDVEEATRRSIRVVNAPGANSDTIAEHALTLMLMLVRNVWKSAERVRSGRWEWRNQYSGDEIRGKTLGIVGMGNIGQRVARLADAFGMKVIFWDKFSVETRYNSVGFRELLQEADIVTLHVPLLEATTGLIGAEELSLMKPGAYLINTARGGLIREEDLYEALESGALGGFAADVLSEEPPALQNSIPAHPNALITPHTGSLTTATYRHMCVSTVENTVAILAGEQPEPGSVFNRDQLE